MASACDAWWNARSAYPVHADAGKDNINGPFKNERATFFLKENVDLSAHS
jgi:hypothetical protein